MASIFNPMTWMHDVHVIGQGGIGSWLTIDLAVGLRLPSLDLYDEDVPEDHNIGPQAFTQAHVDNGTPKVIAIAETVQLLGSPTEVSSHVMRVGQDCGVAFSGIVILCVDNMKSRAEIWQLLRYNHQVELVMDARLAGDEFHLHTLDPCDPDQVERYEAWMHTDEEASVEPCAVRDDMHSASAVRAFITHNLVSFARDKPSAGLLQGELSAVPETDCQSVVVLAM